MPLVLSGDGITSDNITSLAASKLTGQVPDANAPPGSVIQVVTSTQVADQVISQSGSASENRGSTWYDTSGLNITLTPISTSNRILVFGHVCLGTNSENSYNIHWRLVRNGTAIGNGTGQNWPAMGSVRNINGAGPYVCPFSFVDSPSSTSALTYKLQVLQTYNANVIRINRNTDDGWQSGASSTITALEISA
jgi:hypothetical protein